MLESVLVAGFGDLHERFLDLVSFLGGGVFEVLSVCLWLTDWVEGREKI